jgi:hypothetical protein
VNRYARQERVVGNRRREKGLALIGGGSSPLAARFFVAAAAGAGFDVAADFAGVSPLCRLGHWFWDDYASLAGRVNPEVRYLTLDPMHLVDDLEAAGTGKACLDLLVFASDPQFAKDACSAAAHARIPGRVVLLEAGPMGVYAERCRDASAAARRLGETPFARRKIERETPAWAQQVGVGAALSDLMLHDAASSDSEAEPLFLYSRLHAPSAAIEARAVEELLDSPVPKAARSGGEPSFSRVYQIGCGALGTWFALLNSLSPAARETRLFDGDIIEDHNLARQILYPVSSVAMPKADVLSAELNALAGRGGGFIPRRLRVERPGDLGDLGADDLVVCLPDNDEARQTAAEAASSARCAYSTAASSFDGGEIHVRLRGEERYRPAFGPGEDPAGAAGSCALAEQDSIVATNMLAAALLFSELEMVASGGKPRDLRFSFARGVRGNHLGRAPRLQA